MSCVNVEKHLPCLMRRKEQIVKLKVVDICAYKQAEISCSFAMAILNYKTAGMAGGLEQMIIMKPFVRI